MCRWCLRFDGKYVCTMWQERERERELPENDRRRVLLSKRSLGVVSHHTHTYRYVRARTYLSRVMEYPSAKVFSGGAVDDVVMTWRGSWVFLVWAVQRFPFFVACQWKRFRRDTRSGRAFRGATVWVQQGVSARPSNRRGNGHV